MKIAIVILNWNGKDFLEKFLPVVIKYSKGNDIQIYIVDNGSSDDSLLFLKQFEEVKTISFNRNYGFTGGYNKALSQINAQYFILLNSDVEVTENWINPIIDLMDADDTIAACMPKLLSYSDRNKFEYAGAAGGFIDKYGYPFCRGRILSEIETDSGQYNDIKEIFWATGACMFVRANLFAEAGAFDNDFFAHMEEIDLCWRLKNMGYKIMYVGTSTVYHVGGGTLPNNNPKKLYYNYRNNLTLLYKNLPPSKITRIIFSRLTLDGLSAIMYLFNLSFSFFWSVIKAHITFFKELRTIRQKRKSLLKLRKNSSHNEIYGKSIVIDFFLRKKRLFNKIMKS